MDEFGKHLRSDAKRSWPVLAFFAAVELVKMLLEHSILGAINEYIDAHSEPILNGVRPFLIWSVHTPFVLLTLTVCGILIHAYIRSQHDMHSSESPLDLPLPPAPNTSVRQEANSTVIANPVVNANPIIHASPKIEIHNHTTQPESGKGISRQTPPAGHNVQFAGVKRILTDLEREVFDGTGTVGVRACFLNRTVPDRQITDFDSATARVVIKDSSGREVAETDKPKWLNRDLAQFVDIRVNSTACLLLAVYGNGNTWMMPCLVQAPANYWDDGSSGLIVDGQEIPQGELEIEITLASGDGLGLHPVIQRLSLGQDGQVEIRPQLLLRLKTHSPLNSAPPKVDTPQCKRKVEAELYYGSTDRNGWRCQRLRRTVRDR